MLQCKRLHGEEQVVSYPFSVLDGLDAVLFCLKLGNLVLLAIRGALLLNHQIVWLNIKLLIWLVQTSLKLDGVSFRMWLDERESRDLTCFVVFNVTIGLDPPSSEVSESRIQPFCHA